MRIHRMTASVTKESSHLTHDECEAHVESAKGIRLL